jgi:site-specific DNA-methyltransferase (adenine-specific)
LADNLAVLRQVPGESVDLVYVDPPFNTGKRQTRTALRTVRDEGGDRTGFGGRRYRTVRIGSARSFEDAFDDYLAFLEPRLVEAHRVLKPTGSFYLHLDYREVHYAKVLADGIFGRECFLNEVVWAYDYGARTRRRWPAKHDDILVYVKDPERYFFDADAVDRIPYMAPDLVGPEKAARGKLPTDTWWHTIVSPTGKEKLGYPTQKPVGILRRIVRASCPPGGVVLDFFAGSGTAGAAARELGRRFVMVDASAEAYGVMRRRFATEEGVVFVDASGSACPSGGRPASSGSACPSGGRPASGGASGPLGGGEAGLEIGQQIARVLQTDGQADEAIADTEGAARVGR